MNINEKNLNSVFNQENSRRLIIPVFQRSYSWNMENIDKFISDLSNEEENLFMGVILGLKKDKDNTFSIIDGQQRITTISIFILALFERFQEILNEKPELKNGSRKIPSLVDDFEDLLSLKKDKKKTKLQLSIQNENKEDWEYFVKNSLLDDKFDKKFPKIQKPKNLGNRRLASTYKYLKEYLTNTYNEVEEIEYLIDKIKTIKFIELEVSELSEAFRLFDVLNNRGMSLSALDIIKNYLFEQIYNKKKKKNEDDIEESNKTFKKIIDNLGDGSLQTRFLRHYYNAFKHNPNVGVEGVEKATMSRLVKTYEAIGNRDSSWLIEDLHEKSYIYKKFNFPEEVQNNELKYWYSDLLNLGIAPAYSLLMYLECEFNPIENEKLKLNDYIKILELLRKFFIKRLLLNDPPSMKLDDIFTKIIKEINENKSENIFNIIKNKLFNLTDDLEQNKITISENIELIKKKLNQNMYEINSNFTRYLLAVIETNDKHSDIDKNNLWKKENNKFIFTIEHILPQKGTGKDNIWIGELSELNYEKARDLNCHKLGNLTLTTKNSNLSDMSFNLKKNRTIIDENKREIKIGYNNNFYLNKYIMKQEKWKIKNINERTEQIINKTMEILDLEKLI